MTCLLAHEALFYMEFVTSYHNQVYHQIVPDSSMTGLVDFEEEFLSPCSIDKYPARRKDGGLICMLGFRLAE